MIEHYLILTFYIGAFFSVMAIGIVIVTVCDYISSRKVRKKCVEDRSLSYSVRQIKIKPQRPAYIKMIKKEYDEEAGYVYGTHELYIKSDQE